MAMKRCEANLHFYDTEKYKSCPYCEGLTANREPTAPVEKVYSETGDTCTAPTVVMDAQKIKLAIEPGFSQSGLNAEQPASRESDASPPGDQEFVQTILATGGMAPSVAPTPPPVVEAEPAFVAAPSKSPYEQLVRSDATAEPVMPEPDQKTVMLFKESPAFNPIAGWLVCLDGPGKGKDYRIRTGMNEIGREEHPEVDIMLMGDSTVSRRNHALLQYDDEDNGFYLIRLKNDAVKVNDATIKRPTRLSPYDILQLGATRLVFVPLCSDKFQWPAAD